MSHYRCATPQRSCPGRHERRRALFVVPPAARENEGGQDRGQETRRPSGTRGAHGYRAL